MKNGKLENSDNYRIHKVLCKSKASPVTFISSTIFLESLKHFVDKNTTGQWTIFDMGKFENGQSTLNQQNQLNDLSVFWLFDIT